jgi:DNA cross-link repair 1A protein
MQSFRDLTCFCCALDIGRIVPTVNVHTAKSRENMRGWVDKWSAYKKKEGKLVLEEGQTRW